MVVNEQERIFKELTGVDFNGFYKENRPKLAWALSKWTKDYALAEDYTDDAFIKALKSINTFDSSKSIIKTWVYKIGFNIVKKNYKDQLKMQMVSMDNDTDDAPLNLFLPSNDNLEYKERLCENNKKANIAVEAILTLPERYKKYKTVLIMRELEHMQYQNIAEELNLNLSTVKSQIKKGREIICKKIEKQLEYIETSGLEFYDTKEIPPIRLSDVEINSVVSEIKSDIQDIKITQINLECEIKSELKEIVEHYRFEYEVKNEISIIVEHLQIEDENRKEILTIANYYNDEKNIKNDVCIIIHHFETEKIISDEIYLINNHFQIEHQNQLFITDDISQNIIETSIYYFIESLLNKQINCLI